MNKYLCFIICAFVLISCNGLNQTILEPLPINKLKKNINKDTTFSETYQSIQEIREWMLGSDTKQAKYGEITYKRMVSFLNKIKDTTFTKKIYDKHKDIYSAKYPSYDKQVDSIKSFWSEYKDKYNLDSLVKIEFADLWKEYYYDGDVKDVNVGFRITPLKGRIEQLIFRYYIRSKISGNTSPSVFDYHKCLYSRPTSVMQVSYWEADYSDEKFLKSRSTDEIKRDYNFFIEVVEVRMNGENMSEKLDVIPESVESALKWDVDGWDIYSDDIIKDLINPDYKSFSEYIQPFVEEAKRDIDTEVYDLLKEYFKIDED